VLAAVLVAPATRIVRGIPWTLRVATGC
jgi:hypothetical protein